MRATDLLRFLPAGLLISVVACAAPEAQTPSTFLQFDRVIEIETAAATSANVSIGDVNGYGSLDLVLAKGRHCRSCFVTG